MTPVEDIDEGAGQSSGLLKLPLVAVFIALLGIADAVYLTVHHYTAEPVPCSIISGCEQVLNSQYATLGGILMAVAGDAASGLSTSALGQVPLAGLGGLAYFIAFSLALLTAFGDRRMWSLFGIHVVLMSIFTAWLIYLQGYVIGAFCQFCLISALTTYTLLVIYVISKIKRTV